MAHSNSVWGYRPAFSPVSFLLNPTASASRLVRVSNPNTVPPALIRSVPCLMNNFSMSAGLLFPLHILRRLFGLYRKSSNHQSNVMLQPLEDRITGEMRDGFFSLGLLHTFAPLSGATVAFAKPSVACSERNSTS